MIPVLLTVLPILATIVTAAAFCILRAGHLPIIVRVAAIFPFVGICLFSVYGFIASGEPGLSPLWKVGYGIIFLSCLVAATRLAFARRRAVQ